MRKSIAVGAAALLLATGGGVLVGCGGSDTAAGGATTAAASADTTAQAPNGIETLSAEEILAKSLAAAQAASSVTVKGDLTKGGQKMALNLQLGEDVASGSIEAQGASVEIRMVGGKAYLKISGEDLATMLGKGSDSAVAKAAGTLLEGKWLLVPADSSSSLGSFSDFGKKDDLLKGLLTSDNAVAVKGTGEANGVPVVLLEGSKKDGTLAIQTVGEPLPVQVKGSGDTTSGEIDFVDWNVPVQVTAPTEVLDVSALAQLGGSN